MNNNKESVKRLIFITIFCVDVSAFVLYFIVSIGVAYFVSTQNGSARSMIQIESLMQNINPDKRNVKFVTFIYSQVNLYKIMRLHFVSCRPFRSNFECKW